jgi:hypothetical protein
MLQFEYLQSIEVIVTPMWVLRSRRKFPRRVLWTLCKYYNLNILIHIGYCDSNVGIVFEEGKTSVCFVNSMWVLHLRKKNLVCVLWTLYEYCIWEEKIWRVFCELYVGIALEEKKSNVCFVNSMWVLHLRRKNPMCVLWTPCGYCNLYTFNLVVNKHWECKYCIFCIGEESCLWKYSRIIKHAYKKWFWIWLMKDYIDKCQKVSWIMS